jgi:hypothetical protein
MRCIFAPEPQNPRTPEPQNPELKTQNSKLKTNNYMKLKSLLFLLLAAFIVSCTSNVQNAEEATDTADAAEAVKVIDPNPDKYTSFRLTADVDQLSDNYKQMIPILIEASKIMDELFWYEAYGEKEEFLADVTDERIKTHFNINYGPWDRLENNAPFVEGVGAKPAGANYYPKDMTKEEFEAADLEGKESLYTFIRRDDNGKLKDRTLPGDVPRAG